MLNEAFIYISFTIRHLRIASNFSASNEIEVFFLEPAGWLAGWPGWRLLPLGYARYQYPGKEARANQQEIHLLTFAFALFMKSRMPHFMGIKAVGEGRGRSSCYAHILLISLYAKDNIHISGQTLRPLAGRGANTPPRAHDNNCVLPVHWATMISNLHLPAFDVSRLAVCQAVSLSVCLSDCLFISS